MEQFFYEYFEGIDFDGAQEDYLYPLVLQLSLIHIFGDVLAHIIPQFVGGMIYGAVSESFASEQGARRTAMEAASDNAEEMIASLSLMYNRARQGAITQEITEISAGFEALS